MQTISLDNEKNISLEEKLDQLDSLGFNTKRKRNEKLLKRTNGNVEVVRNFLLAKEQLKESSKRQKSERKIEKHKKKFGNDRKERKKNYEKFRKNPQTEGCSNSFEQNSLDVAQIWPTNVTHLFLDGNNMLFVLAPLRNLAIKQRNISEAERILSTMARKFAQDMKIENCTLIFDDTKLRVDEPHFKVCSARPSYSTSDDALVDFAKINKGIYVTSDRELINRLKECGGTIIKPKSWFQLVATNSSDVNNQVVDLDNWANQWVEKITSQISDMLTL